MYLYVYVHSMRQAVASPCTVGRSHYGHTYIHAHTQPGAFALFNFSTFPLVFFFLTRAVLTNYNSQKKPIKQFVCVLLFA